MFDQDAHVTPVIFRMWPKRKGGEVIALFPADAGTYDPGTCSSYVHVGQHGSADPQYVVNTTRAATPDEYADLVKELEGPPFGYRLRIYRRMRREWFEARLAQLQRIK